MMVRKSRIEELNVVADPWNLKLKPAKLKALGRTEDSMSYKKDPGYQGILETAHRIKKTLSAMCGAGPCNLKNSMFLPSRS
jgi:hypothetical protein